jgi:hypothetical protein
MLIINGRLALITKIRTNSWDILYMDNKKVVKNFEFYEKGYIFYHPNLIYTQN